MQRSKRLSSVKLRQSAEVAEPVPSDLLALECALIKSRALSFCSLRVENLLCFKLIEVR